MQQELILNFHGIGKPHRDVGPEEQPFWMSHACFVDLLDQISAARTTNEIQIAITFDDGNDSDFAIALPELCKHRLDATFFVCAGRLGKRNYLDSVSLRGLQNAGMKIGSHGMHHRDWRVLDDASLTEEIYVACKRLEDVCGNPITSVAIPFGSYDRRVLSKLRANGVASVYTSDGGLARSNSWLKPRNTLGQNARPEDITRLLSHQNLAISLFRLARRLHKKLR